MRERIIEEIVCRDRNRKDWEEYSSFECPAPELLNDPIQQILASVKPEFGSCVMLSDALALYLSSQYSVPAIAVVGDLNLFGKPVFKCNGNIPTPKNNEIIKQNWDGHCWVEIGGVVCDISIFRSAYNTNRPSRLKQFITSEFGEGKGAIISPPEYLPPGLEYVPKYVLTDVQLESVMYGLASQQ